MPITRNQITQETITVLVTGSGGPEDSGHITLQDLDDLVKTAKSSQIPADTVVQSPALGGLLAGTMLPVVSLQFELVTSEVK